MTYHLLNRASQKCSFDKSSSTHSPFPNVRAYIHSHLHRDSFHCHFTPFIGSVWTPLPLFAPGYQAASSGRDPCWGVALRKRLDNAAPISQPPPPHSQCIITFLLPFPSILFPRGFGLKQEHSGDHLFPELFLSPAGLPLYQSFLMYSLWLQSVSVCAISSHTNSQTQCSADRQIHHHYLSLP